MPTIKTIEVKMQTRQLFIMDFRYRWKNGRPPSRDEAAREKYLLDESQFDSEKDHKLAEETARRHLGIPILTPDDERSTLPHSTLSNENKM